MKQSLLWPVVVAVLFCIGTVTAGFAQSADWEDQFVEALHKGKEAAGAQSQAEGLGYTPSEEAVFEKAVKKALGQDAPACQCMKIAVNMDYNPYMVLTNIYGAGKGVKLDELCMCATEEGIRKEVIARAASDAVGPSGEKVFTRDEVTQSQCLQVGLPYTAAEVDLPDAPEDPDPVPPDSVSTP